MSTSSEKLGSFLREVSNWSWDAFVRAEKDKQYSSNEAIIFALVRACSMQHLQAIKVAVKRLDGELKTPIKVEYPKVFYLYPNAKIREGQQLARISEGGYAEITDNPNTVNEVKVRTDDELTEQSFNDQNEAIEEMDLVDMGFRETLSVMSDYPRELPEGIVALALQTEQWIRKQAPEPSEIPKVKSVVVAHLLIMAQNRNMDAISEVFDQIDGKLVQTLQVLGKDIYITDFSETAPPDAVLNEKGVLQTEASLVQDMWATKLGREISL